MDEAVVFYDQSPFLEYALTTKAEQCTAIRIHNPKWPHVGDVYVGKIARIINSLKLVFVDVGLKEHVAVSFKNLGYDVLREKYLIKQTQAKSIGNELIGQSIAVQITQLPYKNKGYVGSTEIALVGRYLVLTLGSKSPGLTVAACCSKQSTSYELLFSSQLDAHPCNRIAIRSHAEGIEASIILREYDALYEQFHTHSKLKQNKGIYYQQTLLNSCIHELKREQRIHVDSKTVYQELIQQLPKFTDLSTQNFMLTSTYISSGTKLDDLFSQALTPDVALPSGGNVIIEQTQAATVIDVNAAKALVNQSNSQRVNFSTNLDACDIIVEQIVLRNITGLIVVDFINSSSKQQYQIKQRLQSLFLAKKQIVSVGNFSKFGLLELTRKKYDLSVREYLLMSCQQCYSPNSQKTFDFILHNVYKEVQRCLSSSKLKPCRVSVSCDLYEYYKNNIQSIDIKFKALMQNQSISWCMNTNYYYDEYQVLFDE